MLTGTPKGQGLEVLTAAGLPHRHRDPMCPQSDSASGRWCRPGDQHPEVLPANPPGGPGTNQNRQLQGLDWPDPPGDPFAHIEEEMAVGCSPTCSRLLDREKVEPRD